MRGQTYRHVRGVLRVMQNVGNREVSPAIRAQTKLDDPRMRRAQIELREEITRLRRFDVVEPVARELVARVDYYQVIGVKAPPDVVDADGDETFRLGQFVERFSA